MTDREKIALIEKINNLLKDEKTKERRTACKDFVDEKLGERVEAKLEEIGFNKEKQKAFASNEKEAVKSFVEFLKNKGKEINISNREIKEVITLSILDKAKAVERLKEYLLRKERIILRKDIEITAKVFNEFMSAKVYTEEKTLEKIAEGLGLKEGEEDYERLKSLRLSRFFLVPLEFREKVQKEKDNTGMKLEDFLLYALLEKDPWQSFSTKSKGEKRTSQGTLLKLIAAFGYEEKEARAFLNEIGSDFIMICDLAFLTAITEGYRIFGRKDPIDVAEVVDFLSEPEEKFAKNFAEEYDCFESPYKV